MSKLVSLVAIGLVAVVHGQEANPRVCALRVRSLEELKVICEKASVPVEDEATAEDLRIALYAKLQAEIPGAEIEQWPGPGEPGECEHFHAKIAAAKQAKEASQAQEAAKTAVPPKIDLHKRLDSDGDGKLSRAEMQGMIDSVNKAAEAKGEATYDLFTNLDKNVDGFVDKAEAEAFFDAVSRGQMPPSGGGGKPSGGGKGTGGGGSDTDNMADGLFTTLDADADGQLSKSEMASVLGKWSEMAKSQGEEEGDFFATMDVDANGYVSRTEAKAVLDKMVAALKGEGGGSGSGMKSEL